MGMKRSVLVGFVVSLLVHGLLALGLVAYFEYAPGPDVLATLDLSSVELSFAEEEREVAPSTVPTVSSRSGADQAVSKAVPVPSVEMPRAGTWRVWARTKDWLPEFSPGAFTLVVGGYSLLLLLLHSSKDS
mgnify:CR=1 FL=1